MTVIKLDCTFTVPDSYTKDQVQHLADCLVEYVTLHEGVLASDYGPGAWGGYDGAVIVHSLAKATVGDYSAAASGDWSDLADDDD